MADASLAEHLIEQIEQLLLESERCNAPLELDPYRKRMFELFVTAEGAGYLDEATEHNLSADGLCRQLAERWGLDEATRSTFANQPNAVSGTAAASLPAMMQALGPEYQAKIRILWSMMRMWMEWSYAWHRWPEFHGDEPE